MDRTISEHDFIFPERDLGSLFIVIIRTEPNTRQRLGRDTGRPSLIDCSGSNRQIESESHPVVVGLVKLILNTKGVYF